MNNIKKRLKDAYDNVTFYASNTWTCDCHLYQKANQELYARHIKLQETFAEDVTRARTVRDSIPQSKLAQYSNYEYDEARELSYTPNGGDVIIHYPCQQKKEGITEPWMLPEVEQLFVWLTYSRDFNLLRYRDLVEFEHAEGTEPKDLHQVDPRFYEVFERTPGKARFTSSDHVTDADLQSFVPPLLNLNTFEDMTVKMKIDLDAIKKIWKTDRPGEMSPPKLVQVFKSPFNNLFVNENSKFAKHQEYFNLSNAPYVFNDLQERVSDFKNLQNSAELLKQIKESRATRSSSMSFTPTKRLYSDVVSNKNSFTVEVGSPPPMEQSSSCKDLPKVDEMCSNQSCKIGTAVTTKPPTPPPSWLEQAWTAKPEKKTDCNDTRAKSFLNCADTVTLGNNATFVNNNFFGGCTPATNDYHHLNEVPGFYAGGFCPFPYTQNNVYCPNFPGAPYPNHLATNARTFMQPKQNPIHFNNSQWIMHQYRAPSIYFPPQPYFLLPSQPPKPQRWMQSAHYTRPPMHQAYGPQQNWAGLYKTSSTQHISQYQVFENTSLSQKYKNRKINSQINLAYAKGRNRSPENSDKFRTRPAFKKTLIIKKVQSTVSKDFESLSVTASTSDELERQALDEYQSSSESFYKELERQAEEQYEGSENSLGPPNDEVYFGGLACLHEFVNFCLIRLLLNTTAAYVYLRCN